MSSTVDPNQLYLESIQGVSLVIICVSVSIGAVSFVVVVLRTYVRLHEKVFGWDDGFMLGGLCIFIVEIGLACQGARSGLGTLSEKLNATMAVNAMMYMMIWLLLYICSLVLIKCSICITMYRIANSTKAYRWCIYVLIGVIITTFLTTFIGVLLLCRPVEANWNSALLAEGKATCASIDALIGLSYASTTSSIATDMASAVLPGVILWKTQMKLSTKIWVSALLSFGSFAFISTIIRTPYIEYYRHPLDNLPYYVGHIMLWSNIETAIGLVAGSLPSLRRFILATVKKPLSSDPKPGGDFNNPTDMGVSVATVHAHGDGDWRRLRDEMYEARSFDGTRRDDTYEIELMQSPVHQSHQTVVYKKEKSCLE